MKTMMIALAAGAGMLATAGAVAQQNKVEIPALKNLSQTETRRCVPFDRVTDIRSERGAFLFREGRNRVFVNEPTQGCEYGMRANDIVVTRTITGQYCSGDVVRMRARSGGQMSGACALGEFKVYERAAAN